MEFAVPLSFVLSTAGIAAADALVTAAVVAMVVYLNL